MKYRSYQESAIASVWDQLRECRSTLVVSPTGTGKTVMIARLAETCPPSGKILLLQDRIEIARQNQEKIDQWLGEVVGLEMGTSRTHTDARIVVASVPTLNTGRINKFRRDEFGLIIIDEAHHSVADSYRKVLEYFAAAFIVGFTATPERADGVGLCEIFDDCAFHMTIAEAISNGWLVPITERKLHVEGVEYPEIDDSRFDFTQEELDAILTSEEDIHAVVDPFMENSGDRPSIIFWPNIRSAKKGCEIINRHVKGDAVWVSGAMNKKDRWESINAFKTGQARVLCNVGVATEGFDYPPCSCVGIARPTRSRGRYEQMLGRGLRPGGGVVDSVQGPAARKKAIAASSKPDCLLLDFCSNNHDLAGVVDVLGQEMDLAEVEMIKRKFKDEDEIDWQEAMEIKDEDRLEIMKIRSAMDMEKLETIKGKAVYSTSDPWKVFGQKPVLENWQKKKVATEPQKQRLKELGVPTRVTPSSLEECRQLIDMLEGRAKSGLVGYQKACELVERGIRPEVISTMESANVA